MPSPENVHPDIRLLHAYLDNALAPDERLQLQAHMRTCPACAAELTDLEALFTTIASLPEAQLSRDLTPAVFAEIRPHRLSLPDLRRASGIQLVLTAIIIILAAPIVMQGLIQPTITRLPPVGYQIDGWVEKLAERANSWINFSSVQLVQQGTVLAERWQAFDWVQLLGWLWLLIPAVLVWLLVNTALLRTGQNKTFRHN